MLIENSPGSFAEPEVEVRAAAAAVLAQLDRSRWIAEAAQHLFYGLSLGSVLLLAALGLAITFGLMRVINMAHGEMLMLGAYATYGVQLVFQRFFPDAIDLYVIAAVPAAFAVSACVGMLMERCVIRFLYGRPLETLLTTWGISLILIQSVRLTFGAQNVAVGNPSWLSGGIEASSGAVLPYARIATVLFAGGVVTLMWFLLQRTRLGLQVRAVTQNREMASSMGIPTARIDMWTFGLGSGIAGLGGVALAQLGNVGPELGQGYIVDSFMVVVLGGVGSLAGTVWGALALGIVNKVLEPTAGAVLGKIVVLGAIILFIQRRPEGIFALRGRAAEA
jgi:urea transport system permease protein